MITIIKTDFRNEDFHQLTKALDEDLIIKDGDEHDFYNQFNGLEGINQALVVYGYGKPIGCGAFKPFTIHIAEIKRMFVVPEYQGIGIGTKILEALETWAESLRYDACILETGTRQTDAIALYKKNGYQIIENYGQYKGVKNSVCFKKKL
jgi:GNAT superfamily N-acetyltransferase